MEPIKYIPENSRDTQWGLTVCSVGYQHVRPGQDYPPRNHNKEYIFDPQKGRMLHEYQLLYICSGKGTLHTSSCPTRQVEAGDMFLIFPGEWHTYQPDPATGWQEYFIGFQGTNIDHRVQAGFFSPHNPVYRIGHHETAIMLYNQAIQTATQQEAYFQQLLAGIVNHLLGLMFMVSHNRTLHDSARQSTDLVDRARHLMQEMVEHELTMPQVADQLNISYATFRHLFKRVTGLSPVQYFINLRLHRAKELLRGTDTPIKEISYMLHFENPEYFATLFKKRTGFTPSEFRHY